MHSLIQSISYFNSYIKGGSSSELEEHMTYYDTHLVELNRNFHLITLESDDEITEAVKSLLKSMDIPPAQMGRYFGSNLTVYELLLELHKEHHIQAHFLIQLIDKKRKSGKLLFGVGIMVTAMILIGIISIPGVSPLIGLVESLLASSLSIPLFGSLFNLSVGGYSFYRNQLDRKKTNFNRWRDNLFMFGNAACTFTAYGIWMATAINMTPLIAAFFIAASVFDVLKETTCLIQTLFKRKPPVSGENDLNINRSYSRNTFSYKKHRNAAIINLVSSMLLLGIMTCWCVLPGGFLVTLVAVPAVILVYTVKTLLLKANETWMRERLQEDLRDIELAYQQSKAGDIELVDVLSFASESTQSTIPLFTSKPSEDVVGKLQNEDEDYGYNPML